MHDHEPSVETAVPLDIAHFQRERFLNHIARSRSLRLCSAPYGKKPQSQPACRDIIFLRLPNVEQRDTGEKPHEVFCFAETSILQVQFPFRDGLEVFYKGLRIPLQ